MFLKGSGGEGYGQGMVREWSKEGEGERIAASDDRGDRRVWVEGAEEGEEAWRTASARSSIHIRECPRSSRLQVALQAAQGRSYHRRLCTVITTHMAGDSLRRHTNPVPLLDLHAVIARVRRCRAAEKVVRHLARAQLLWPDVF